MELLQAAFSYSNFLFTILFMLVIIYWMIVIVGAIKIDSLDFNMHHDVHVDIPHGADAGNHLHHDVPSGGSWFFGMLRFFNFGRVPLMVVLSILILSMWTISMACNHVGSILNPYNSFLLSLLYVIPNIVASAFVMKFLSTPLIPLFDKLDTHETSLHYEGYSGKLTTDVHENGIGQAKILINNSTITVSVKTKDGDSLNKGDAIIILNESQDKKYYIIEKSQELLPD
jgi:hypothetical protein